MDKTPISTPLGMAFADLRQVRAEDAAGQPYSHKPGCA